MAPIGALLGRYRLERELGRGAMGVVHAAFDADLERRIALKVLRSPAAPREAKERLLREARAMARLTHPNVVTVHEVGTAGGRDYVAMELIHGETLAAWLKSNRRSPPAIIDAFIAAGRGLAAAHAAGIVHRDFKPSNVLCSRDGRIVVTDFGLARAADAAPQVGTSGEPSTPRSPAELTVTGAQVGTPPYMAPEQWCDGTITPATDQFAYCVALWEAFEGKRPYCGQSSEALRAQIMAGPAMLDASRIPRGLRRLLRRGLDPDPARRWPTMEAVLVRLERARRRPSIAFAVAAAAAMAVVVPLVVTRSGTASASACEPPLRDVTRIWSPAIADDVRAKASDAHAKVLGNAYEGWRAARARACASPQTVKREQLQCLDGVLVRFDVLRRAYMRVPDAAPEALETQMVVPDVCIRASAADVPRLTLIPSPGVLAAYTLLARSETEHKPAGSEITALIDAPTTSPCARVVATFAFILAANDVPRARALMVDALGAADQCGDARVLADLRIRDVLYRWESPIIGPRGEAAIKQAEHAAVPVMQPELVAALALYRAVAAHQRGQWDEALQWIEDELAAYGTRGQQGGQLQAVLMRNYLRFGRGRPSDLDAIGGDVQAWRAVALARREIELARQLDVLAAKARFLLGDVPAARAELVRVWQAQPRDVHAGGRRITGEVTDTHGHAIAGASVAAGSWLSADSVGIGLPDLDSLEDFKDLDLRTATSDATGRFALEDVPPVGVIAAQRGERRSRPTEITDHVKLVLEPTRGISGTIELGATPHTHVQVFTADSTGRFRLIAPVARDGSFTLAGTPPGGLKIGISTRGTREYDTRIDVHALPASSTTITGLQLRIASTPRTIDAVVRSTVVAPIEGAEVLVLSGKHAIASIDDVLRLQPSSRQSAPATPVLGRHARQDLRDRLQPGDLVAHFEHVTEGELTVCAGAYGDASDPNARRVRVAHLAQMAIACKHIGADTNVVELAAPPQPRFE